MINYIKTQSFSSEKVFAAFIIILIILFQLSGCFRGSIRNNDNLVLSSKKEVKALVDKLEELNTIKVDSFSAKFSTHGYLKKNKFNFIGKAVFLNKPRLVKLTFLDSVFKSHVSVLVQNRNDLKLYFPMQKKVFLEKFNTLELKNYLNIDIDFRILYPLVTGNFPVIENYTIKCGYTNPDDKKAISDESKQCYTILENDTYYETISLLKDLPDKILIVNKATKKKIEIYFKKPVIVGNTLFYKYIKVVLPGTGNTIIFKISSISINRPLNPGTIIRLPVTGRVQYIKR